MLDDGLISKEDCEDKKAEILDRMQRLRQRFFLKHAYPNLPTKSSALKWV